MKKFTTLLFAIFFSLLSSAQLVVADPLSQTELGLIKSQLLLLNELASESKLSEAQGLAESIEQGEQLVDEYEQVKDIQEGLETVTSYIKSFKTIENSLTKSYKSLQIFNNIFTKLSSVEDISMDTINAMLDMLNPIIEENTAYVKKIKSLLKDKEIKTDDGTRLNLLTQLEDVIKNNYNKLKQIESVVNDIYY